MKLAGFWQDGGFADTYALLIDVIVAVIITIVAVLGILFYFKMECSREEIKINTLKFNLYLFFLLLFVRYKK
jgi:hypothetical protein